MKCRVQTHLPRGLRFPVPLDKGNEGSGDEIGPSPTTFASLVTQCACDQFSRAGFKMAAVRGWLESRHVYVQNDWLEACINFVREDNEVLKLCVNTVCNITAKNASYHCIEYVGKAVVRCRAERVGI